MDMTELMKALGGIEGKLNAFAEKASEEIKSTGAQSVETKNAIEKLGESQREMAERLLLIEQRGASLTDDPSRKVDDWGQQFVKSERYKAFQTGASNKVRFEIEIKNTIIGDDTTVAPDRKPGVVPGSFQPLVIESLYPSLPTSSNAIEFTKEASFTNNAAEVAEGAAKPESAITFSLVNMPVSTVAHWVKISRQLAADNAALAAYINTRMRYGVNKRVDTQLVSGNGTAPNISGFLDTGNFTAHGIADAALGSVLKKLVLIRKMIGDLQNAGYAPDAIVLNPVDWATIELDLLTSTSNANRITYDAEARPMLFGVRVIPAIGMTADTVAVGAFAMAGTIYNREGVVIDMSESDSDNFTKNLITIRAERRLALASEVPAAIRAGDLTPA